MSRSSESHGTYQTVDEYNAAARRVKAELEQDAFAEFHGDRTELIVELTNTKAKLAKAERLLEEAEAVIKPFAAAAEHDISESETDDDMFRPMLAYNRAPRLTVGHLRAARKWMEERHD